ncbi:MAG: radical SAM protein [Candidatus Woesearchaeota archaeon]
MHSSELVRKINSREDFRFSSQDSSLQISSMKGESGSVKGYEIIFRITGKCNFRCLYCGVESQGLSRKSFLKLVEALEKSDLKGSSITISGGEPTISRDFIPALQRLIETDCKSIIVQTNATMLSNGRFISQIPHDERILFFISFPSHLREHYEAITQSKLYDKAVRGLTDISARSRFEICMVINRINYKEIAETVKFVEQTTGRRDFQFTISNVFINPMLDPGKFIVRYSDVTPYIIEAQSEYSDIIALPSSGDCSFPYCAIPSLMETHGDIIRSDNTSDVGYGTMKHKFFKLPTCKRCRYDGVCTGYHTEYVKRFGTSEINPIP